MSNTVTTAEEPTGAKSAAIRFASADGRDPLAFELWPGNGEPPERGRPETQATTFVLHRRARGPSGGLVTGTTREACATVEQLLHRLNASGFDDVVAVEVVGHVARGPGREGELGGVVGRLTTSVPLHPAEAGAAVTAVAVTGVGVVVHTDVGGTP